MFVCILFVLLCSFFILNIFHAHDLQCSEGFMHTRMRRRVESLIQVRFIYLFIIIILVNSPLILILDRYDRLSSLKKKKAAKY